MAAGNPVSIDVLLGRASVAIMSGRRDSYYLPLLPLLEHPWPAAVDELSGCLDQFDVFEEKADKIAEDVVAFALAESSQYWVGLALAWIEDGFPVTARIKVSLRSTSGRKQLPQAERHSAWRLFHKNA